MGSSGTFWESFWDSYGCFFVCFGGLAILLYIPYAFFSSERYQKWEESVTFYNVVVFVVGAGLLFFFLLSLGGGGGSAKPFVGFTRNIDNDDTDFGE